MVEEITIQKKASIVNVNSNYNEILAHSLKPIVVNCVWNTLTINKPKSIIVTDK